MSGALGGVHSMYLFGGSSLGAFKVRSYLSLVYPFKGDFLFS